MKKIVLFYQICSSGDGGANIKWFLDDSHREKYQDSLDEQMNDSDGTVETFIDSDIYKKAVENSKKYEKHEYLTNERYYEQGSVGNKAKSNKTCEHCGKVIPIGEPHDTHKFADEDGYWPTYATHKKCSSKFKESLN